MRLIRITTNYPTYLKQFYEGHPELKTATYQTQYQTLMADCFGWADFWTHAFGQLGYEVWEPVGNAEPMQKVWATENGISFDEKTWLTDIIAAQVQQFQPDIVFVNDYMTYKAKFFQQLRNQCPSIKLIIGWCGAPYQDGRVFKEYDVVLSNIPSLVTHFREKGHRCEHILHAFEPRILEKLNRYSVSITPFSFVGSLVKGKNFHNQREELLKQLVEKTQIKIWSDIQQPSMEEKRRIYRQQMVYDWGQILKSLPGAKSWLSAIPKLGKYATIEQRPDFSNYVDSQIAQQSEPALFGLAMYQKLYESQVTLNNHIDLSAQFASNMRLYEATGVGTCLLTDWQSNLHELFEPDVEVVTYRSPEEAVEKVHYLLDHDNERKKITQAGQQKTLTCHTFNIRAQQLDQLIRRNIS